MSSFTNAVYDVTTMGEPVLVGSFYSLTAANDIFSLATTGTYNGEDVRGIIFNSTDFSNLTAVDTIKVVTLSGVNGDTPTVLHFYKRFTNTVTFGVINTNNYSTTYDVTSASGTVVTTVSAGGFDNQDHEMRRKWNLNG